MTTDAELENWREEWQSGTGAPFELRQGSVHRFTYELDTATFVETLVRRCCALLAGAWLAAFLILSVAFMSSAGSVVRLCALAMVGLLVWYGAKKWSEWTYLLSLREPSIVPKGQLGFRRRKKHREA